MNTEEKIKRGKTALPISVGNNAEVINLERASDFYPSTKNVSCIEFMTHSLVVESFYKPIVRTYLVYEKN